MAKYEGSYRILQNLLLTFVKIFHATGPIFIVVSGKIITPARGTVSLVGAAPDVAQSKVLTPGTGTLVLVGGTATVSNPNWETINTSQTPGWNTIGTSQTPGWGTINTAQTPNWVRVAA